MEIYFRWYVKALTYVSLFSLIWRWKKHKYGQMDCTYGFKKSLSIRTNVKSTDKNVYDLILHLFTTAYEQSNTE